MKNFTHQQKGLPLKRTWIIILPLAFSLLVALTILALFSFLPPKLPLFYSLPWGEKQLASRSQLFLLPAIIAITVFCNLIIASQLHDQQSFFKKILFIANLLISVILTITFIKIILIFI